MKITYKKYIFIIFLMLFGLISFLFSPQIYILYDFFAYVSYSSISYFKQIEKAWINFFHLDYEEIKNKYELTSKKLELLQHRCHELSYLEHSKEILKKRLPGVALYNWYCLPATILASIQNNIEQILFIDRGAHNYIQVGLPVIHNNMLIGKIKTINHWFSEVMVLTNTQSKIAITFDKTTLHGIAQGSGNNNCLQVLYVQNSTILKKGQAVYTSGDGLLFPPGLLVGYVNEIFIDGGLYATVTITPALIPEVNDICQIITYDSVHKDCIIIENILKQDHRAISIDSNEEKKIIPSSLKKEKLPEKEKIEHSPVQSHKKIVTIKESEKKKESVGILPETISKEPELTLFVEPKIAQEISMSVENMSDVVDAPINDMKSHLQEDGMMPPSEHLPIELVAEDNTNERSGDVVL